MFVSQHLSLFTDLGKSQKSFQPEFQALKFLLDLLFHLKKTLRRLLQKFRVFLSLVIDNLIQVPLSSSYSTKLGLKAIILPCLISKVLRYPGSRFSSRSMVFVVLVHFTVYENLLPLL